MTMTYQSWSGANGHVQVTTWEDTMLATHDADKPGAAPLAGLRILLVEDSWHVAQAYKSLLEMVGLNVAGPVATVAEAELLVAERMPDIAVVDISLLQGETTYHLIDQLLASHVPTVVVSGYEVSPDLPGRVAAVLVKPVRANLLLATIRRVIAEQRSA